MADVVPCTRPQKRRQLDTSFEQNGFTEISPSAFHEARSRKKPRQGVQLESNTPQVGLKRPRMSSAQVDVPEGPSRLADSASSAFSTLEQDLARFENLEDLPSLQDHPQQTESGLLGRDWDWPSNSRSHLRPQSSSPRADPIARPESIYGLFSRIEPSTQDLSDSETLRAQSHHSQGSSSSDTTVFHSTRSRISLDEDNGDYALALKLQEEENAHIHQQVGDARDFTIAEALQRNLQDELTSQDAALAVELAEQEELERLRASAPPDRECSICTDEKPPLEFPARPPSHLCSHRANTCTACLQQWVEQDLQNCGWQRVSCPECRHPLDHTDIRRAASAEVFARYDALSARGILGTIDNFYWCINVGCDSGQLHDGNEEGLNPEMECAACGFHQCVRHEIAWHAGESCAQYEYRTSGRQQQDADSEETIGLTTQKCPSMRCGARVEKRDGCDHMTCTRCDTQFCYQCGADYAEIRRVGAAAHRVGCQYARQHRYPH